MLKEGDKMPVLSVVDDVKLELNFHLAKSAS